MVVIILSLPHQNRKVINSLEKENFEIDGELKIKEQEHILADDEQQQILQILDKLGQLNKEYNSENQRASEEHRRFLLILQRLNKLETHLQSDDPKEVFHVGKIQSKLFQMKKKLETVTAHFDSLVASNGESRARIDELLEQNVSINKKLTQLETQLGRKKSTAQKLVQEATAAYDQR
jgi:chromosome segregation ATPase